MSNEVLPNDDGIRPAGKPDECFYCRQKVGTPHLDSCVCLHRKVKVRYSFEIEVEVPFSWTKGDIDSHRTESSWCANNAIGEIKEHAEKHGCLCSYFSCEVLDFIDLEPYRKTKGGDEVR